jgi:hypothetical protein
MAGRPCSGDLQQNRAKCPIDRLKVFGNFFKARSSCRGDAHAVQYRPIECKIKRLKWAGVGGDGAKGKVRATANQPSA